MAVLSNVRHERFCLLMVEGKNGPEAYMAAGFAVTDRRVAAANAARLLARDDVKERIGELQVGHAERHKATVDSLVAELTKVAFANAGEFFEWGPNGVTVKDSAKLTEQQKSIVAEVSQTVTEAGGTIRVKLHNKLDAIEKLARHLGMFKDVVELTGKDGKDLIPEETALTKLEMARQVAHMLREGAKAARELEAAGLTTYEPGKSEG